MNRAYVTLATNDNYGLGALVLGHSLRNVHSEADLVVVVTDEISHHMNTLLTEVFDQVKFVHLLKTDSSDLLVGSCRPEWANCMTKVSRTWFEKSLTTFNHDCYCHRYRYGI